MHPNHPYAITILAQYIKVGDVIVFISGDRWYYHKVSSTDGREGYLLIRTDNDMATFSYRLDEQLRVLRGGDRLHG